MLKKEFDVKIPNQINQPNGLMIIYNTTRHSITLDADLVELFGVGRDLETVNYVKRLNAPSTYFIHCDLVNKQENLLNGEPSTVLGRFDIKGNPFEKANYQTTASWNVLCKTATSRYVNSLAITVRDEKGSLFVFKGLPLEF